MSNTNPREVNRTRHSIRAAGGFTLIELMITIIIVGILVGIVVPVYLNATRKASEVTAEHNYKVGCGCVERAYMDLVLKQDAGEEEAVYLDYDPPPQLKSPAPLDAEYMSLREPKIRWSEMMVTGNHSRLGNDGVYKDGEIVTAVPGLERFNWENTYGTVGIITNAVWLDGRWQNNTNAVLNYNYIMVVTMSETGTVHYCTYRLGVPVSEGEFDWNDGWGHP